MPDLPIKPPNKRVAELMTELTEETFEKFKHEKNFDRARNRMITFLIEELANAKCKIELYENSE